VPLQIFDHLFGHFIGHLSTTSRPPLDSTHHMTTGKRKPTSSPDATQSSPPASEVLAPQDASLEAMLSKAMSARTNMNAASDAPDAPPAKPIPPESEQRCGLIAIVGKPNVGKSTLLNALVGQKISITSRKAQTTRHRITGMRTVEATQFVFVDTPGFQTRHGNALNRSLNRTVVGAVNDVDLIVFVVEAGQFNMADAKVLSLLPAKTPAILLANKFDLIHRRAEIAPWLRAMQERHDFAEFVPMSANNAKDIERLFGICEKYLPQQAWMYGAEELTDRSDRFMAAEIIREKLFRLTGDELPYTSTVIIDKYEEEGALRRVAATIVVERDGHKGMIIGEKGEKLKRIGTEARHELERLTGGKVFLEIWVKVRSGWADDEARVKTFGYE
jgi:GTP-binding protein Era